MLQIRRAQQSVVVQRDHNVNREHGYQPIEFDFPGRLLQEFNQGVVQDGCLLVPVNDPGLPVGLPDAGDERDDHPELRHCSIHARHVQVQRVHELLTLQRLVATLRAALAGTLDKPAYLCRRRLFR